MEVALPERDWKRIEAELDAMRPSACETSGLTTMDQVPKRPVPRDEMDIITHIANALRLDSVQ